MEVSGEFLSIIVLVGLGVGLITSILILIAEWPDYTDAAMGAIILGVLCVAGIWAVWLIARYA